MARRRPPTTSGLRAEIVPGARHAVVPAGIVSTGWPAVRDTCANFGVEFDPWQHGTGRVILAKRADGTYAASVGGVVISIPRQVGKTYLIGAIVFALCMLRPGLTVIWTAHRLRTANETFTSMRGFCRRKKIRPHTLPPVLGSGEEEIRFVNGSRILFGARERGFGVGFAGVGVLVLDEAQRLTDTAMDDLVPTMNQAENPLLLLTGTPPRPTDAGEVFSRARTEALSGEATDLAYIEFSADRNCDPMDRAQWAIANASYPRRTPDTAMLRMKKRLTPESFMREGLGVWDEDAEAGVLDLVKFDAGKTETVEESPIVSHRSWALAVSKDHKHAAIGLAGRTEDGRLRLEVMQYYRGTSTVVDNVVTGWEAKRIPIRVSGNAAKAFTDLLRERQVEVEEIPSTGMAQAVGQVIAQVNAGGVVHVGQASLVKAVHAAELTTSGLWVGADGVDVTPLEAVTIAAGGVPQTPVAVGGFYDLDDFDGDDDWEA